jgi:Zn-finger nucleic acid-binding protein
MMKTISDKMICPNCRVEMNYHCDKLVYASDSQGTARMDEGLGGVLEEFHTCPKCAGVAFRPGGRLL